jgi:RNA polymerase primary sigma factor
MPAEADLESSSVTVELVEVTVTEVLVEEEVEDPLAAEEPLPTDLDLEQEEVFVTSATQVDLDDISADDTVSLYLKQMGQVPLLTAVEEVTLARQIEDGDRAQTRMRDRALGGEMRSELSFVVNLGNQARTKLVEANTRLVVSVAKRYIGQGVNFLDLIQEGNIGLMKAVEKFDYHRGYKFSTYATWWIRQGITRALAQQSRLIRLPVHAGDQIRRIYRIAEQLEQETGRRPTPEEIAEKTGLGALKVERLLRISRYPVSLERPVGDDGDTEFGDFIEDEDSPPPADIAYQRLLREALDDVMTSLSAREARILRLRFGLRDGRPHTLEEVGEKFGLTRERIRQIEHQALARLRHPHRSKQLRDYLR